MANGIDFVIGGKDNATPAMDKVDAAMGRLQARTGQLAEASRAATSKLEIGMASLVKGAGVLAAVNLAVDAARAAITRLVGSIGDAAAAYDAKAEAVRGLRSALELSIGASDKQLASLQEAARNLENLTGVSENVTLGLMKQASQLGIHASQLDDVTAAAIGLAEATGQDLGAALGMAADAVQGNFSAFSKVLPQINMMTTAEQKLAMVQQLSAKGMALKASQSESLAGITARAGNAVARLRESIGAMLAPLRMIIAQGTGALADQLRESLAPAAELSGRAIENMRPILEAVSASVKALAQAGAVALSSLWESAKAIGSAIGQVFGVQLVDASDKFRQVAQVMVDVAVSLANRIISGVTAIEVVITNLGPIWEMMKASAELQLTRLAGIVEHALTVQIPAYAQWFARNFTNIIRDAFAASVTVVRNATLKLAEITQLGWDFITSRGKISMERFVIDVAVAASRSLTAGFEATTESLPDVAARKITEREKQLSEKIGDIGAELGQKFTDKFEQRSVKVGDVLKKSIVKGLGDLPMTNLNLQGGFQQDQARLQAQEGRLLARGPGERRDQHLEQIARLMERQAATEAAAASELAGVREAAEKTAANTAQPAPKVEFVGIG